jgi:hypothetical protein
MNDDELRHLLRNALDGRRLPEGARERLWSKIFPRPWEMAWVGSMAAAAIVAIGVLWLLMRGPSIPAVIETAFVGHEQGKIDEHGVASDTVREITQKIKDVTGREIRMPGLRDAGFGQLKAHGCAVTGTAHVIYANSWNKVSCFIFEADKCSLAGGERIKEGGVDGYSFRKGSMTAVAVREGGIVKLWVSDLRPEQLAAIAVDAEQKRYQLKTTVLTASSEAVFKPMGATVMGINGVEDVELEPIKKQLNVRFDPRRVSASEIMWVLETSGMEASPTEWSPEPKEDK